MKKILTLTFALCTLCAQADELKMMVLSDPHVLDKSLLPAEDQYDNTFGGGLLLTEYTQDLFDEALRIVSDSMPDVLLVPGDMSNNGDSISHLYVAKELDKLVTKGIRVCVTPGNHDINEPGAKSYSTVKTGPVTVKRFRELYHHLGYADAEYINDKDNLSYMTYLSDSIALIAVNSALDNTDGHKSAGGISEETLQWVEDMAKVAIAGGRYPYLMTHHQVMRHFDNQTFIDADHVANCTQIDGYPTLAQLQARLVAAGITTVFSGHAHMHSSKDVQVHPEDQIEGGRATTLYDICSNASSSFGASVRTIHFLNGDIERMSATELGNIPSLTAEKRDEIALNRTKNMANSVFNTLTKVLGQQMGDVIANTLMGFIKPEIEKTVLPDMARAFAELERGDETMRIGMDSAMNFAAQCIRDYNTAVTNIKNSTAFKLAAMLDKSITEMANTAFDMGRAELTPVVYTIMLNYTEFKETDTFIKSTEFNRLPDTNPSILRQYTIEGQPTTDLKDVDENHSLLSKPTKLIENSQLIIIRNGIRHNVMGAAL